MKFLLTRRIELNAFASDQFIAWIEAKLKQHGITKVVPDETTLGEAYRRIRQQAKVQLVIDEALDNMDEDEGNVPDTLARKISELQNAEPTLTWDAALKRIVSNTKDKNDD